MTSQLNDRPRASTSPAEWLPRLAARGWRIEEVAAASEGVWVSSGPAAAVDYPAAGHDLMSEVEELSPWYRERARLLAEALAEDGLPVDLVEVGAGNGAVAAHLRGLGVDAVAIEPALAGARRAAARGVPSFCGMLSDLDLPSGALGAAALLDVLEHVADPAPLLAELRRTLEPGGRLAVSVPAMPSMWSQADELAGHHRRYTSASLLAELDAAGFSVRTCRHAFGVLVPAVGALRALPYRLGRRRRPELEAAVGTRQVAGYGATPRKAAALAFEAERRLRAAFDPPIGTSLIAIFVRRR